MTKEQDRKFRTLYNEARLAGLEAGKLSVPTPMIVGQHADILNDASPLTKTYFVGDGVCGFAWIKIRPANCAFANWLKKNGLGKTSSYEGGVSIWVSDFGQSLTRKEAYAAAFAEVLTKAGINAYGDSRMD